MELDDEDDTGQGEAPCGLPRAIEPDDSDEDLYAHLPPLTADMREAIDWILAGYERRGASELFLDVVRENVEREIRLRLLAGTYLGQLAGPRAPKHRPS
jgi:hypothetical protein